MKVRRITVTIEVQVLSIDAAPAMIRQAMDALEREATSGTLDMDDGDTVTWSTEVGALVPVHASL